MRFEPKWLLVRGFGAQITCHSGTWTLRESLPILVPTRIGSIPMGVALNLRILGWGGEVFRVLASCMTPNQEVTVGFMLRLQTLDCGWAAGHYRVEGFVEEFGVHCHFFLDISLP